LEKQYHIALKALKRTEIKTAAAEVDIRKYLEQRAREINEKYTEEYLTKKFYEDLNNI
jgi:hypothetical protein